ncbi:MAG: hypothetical protein WDZ35_07995 [Crocinitomicaceae bacterium]
MRTAITISILILIITPSFAQLDRSKAGDTKKFEIKYESDLTDMSPIDPNTTESDGELFRAI